MTSPSTDLCQCLLMCLLISSGLPRLHKLIARANNTGPSELDELTYSARTLSGRRAWNFVVELRCLKMAIGQREPMS